MIACERKVIISPTRWPVFKSRDVFVEAVVSFKLRSLQWCRGTLFCKQEIAFTDEYDDSMDHGVQGVTFLNIL